MKISCSVAVVVAVVSSGCMGTTTYGYQYQLQQEFTGGEEPEMAPVEARQLLSAAKTVAFYPPDTCINVDPTQDRKRLQELRASCGVLMSKLERGAQAAGYEVVSWQNLRGGRAIDYAREANVDVLFEVNEFDVVDLDDTTVERTLRFFKVDEGRELPVNVSEEVADRCRRYRGGMHQKLAWTGAIDIKTVNVVDGRDRWHYRKTEEERREVTYPRVTFSGKQKRHPLERLLGTFGVLAALTAFDLFLLPQLIEDDPSTPEFDGFDPTPWQWVSAAGAVAFFGGAYAVHRYMSIDPPAATLLCDDKYKTIDPVVITAGTMSAQHTFTETSIQSGETMSRQLKEKMIDDFITALKEVRGPQR
jgi:hypothetical protein